MNVKQLELKRLREALDSVRHARHVVQAMRKPLAQLLRLEHAANVRLKRADAGYERITGEPLLDDDIRISIGASDIPENLKGTAKALADEDKRLQKRIARLQKDRKLLSSAIELRKVRKRLEVARAKKAESRAAKKKVATLELLEAIRAAAVSETSVPVANALETMVHEVQTREYPDFGMSLAIIRHRGRDELADKLKRAFEKYREVAQ